MNTYFAKAIVFSIGATIGGIVCYKIAEHVIDSLLVQVYCIV